jgi:hypothetical protein
MSGSRDKSSFLYKHAFALLGGGFTLFEATLNNSDVFFEKHSKFYKFKHGVAKPLLIAGGAALIGHIADNVNEIYERKVASKK